MTDIDFAPDSDQDVERMVRVLTGYRDAADGLSQADMETALKVGKMKLFTATNSDAFYADAGMGQALVGCTAIYAKAAVENHSVSSWSIGDQRVQTGAFNNPADAQYEQWSELVRTGLQASDETEMFRPTNTAGYVG